MSSLMAAATGDNKWEIRYRKHEPELDKTLKKFVKIQLNSVKVAEETDTANLKLVELENVAFELIRNNRKDEAAAILSGAEYKK